MTDCAIPKKVNVLEAKKMRTIVLMDPLYNMNNKWFGRKFMEHNEALGTLPDEQDSSRKSCRSAETALKKILGWDIQRQQRRAGAAICNTRSSATTALGTRWRFSPCGCWERR